MPEATGSLGAGDFLEPIAEELVPLVLRWVEEETPPAPEELAARKTRRTGGRKP